MSVAQPSRRHAGLPADLVELILLGPEDDRRQLQDSPLLGDVWLAYAGAPGHTQDLLVTSHRRATAQEVAKAIRDRLERSDRPELGRTGIAFLQGIVAVRLAFVDVLPVLVPLTEWWDKRRIASALPARLEPAHLEEMLSGLLQFADASLRSGASAARADRVDALDRFLALAGLILWAEDLPPDDSSVEVLVELALSDISGIAERVRSVLRRVGPVERPLVFQVSRNRRATPSLENSVPAVKADAARTLFRVSCRKIAWAVLDSGIDAEHEAFRDADGGSRVVASYDFSGIRDILSRDSDSLPDARVEELADRSGLTADAVGGILASLRREAEEERPIDWNEVAKLMRLEKPRPPESAHGTHVAGILGGRAPEDRESDYADGMCPDIRLYDFRVLSNTLEETEFAVIAALQYIRFVNQRHSYVTIHGANLSLSIPHSVRNYACGYTPVCSECERLIESGVALVAAAGNRGYQKFKTDYGIYEGYAAFSITDPGNADGVITVGATHPRAPHNYGVSFFSSRGPTGDGRLKPDLVAPGERIQAPIAGANAWGEESGTSMAAPHVSGAAAMLMARYPELVGQPRRVKEILCRSATDLGRERSFQGHGMLDVLRAFQSI